MKKNNLKVLVVEEEQDARDLLKSHLNQVPDVGLIEEASNTEEALIKFININPDIIFLDILTTGKKGDELIELLKRKEPNCHIIIVSAHKESALTAIHNNVYDFILKPIDFDILIEIIEKYHSMIQSSIEEKFRKVLNLVDQGTKLKISSTNSHILIDPNEILYCEADGSYSYLIMKNGAKEIANTYLGKLEKILSEQRFFRISRSVLINLEKLSHVNKSDNTCTLIGDKFEVTLSGSKKQIRVLCEMD